MAAISIENLSKEFVVGFRRKRVQAVNQLSFEVKEGEIFGFVGPNGAGKTTTIKMLMGLIYPTSGSAKVFGQDTREVAPKYDIGFLPERPYFYEYLTAREFLDFYGQLFDLPKSVRQERSERLLKRVSMDHVADTPLKKFSKGMLQRMGMAQALINDPKLVVLDEPMSGLDPLGRMLIRDIILELKREGRTLFFSSHILSDVELICDRVALITRGKIRAVGSLDELLHTRVKYTEITVRTPVKDLPEAVTNAANELADHHPLTLIRANDAEGKRVILQALLESKIDVESVVPRHDTLEDVFLAQVRQESSSGVGSEEVEA